MGSVFGFEVSSDYPLRRLNAAAGTRGTIHVRRPASVPSEPQGEPQSKLESDDGELIYASYATERGCLLTMPPTGDFLIEPGAGTVTVEDDQEHLDLFEHRLTSSAICTLLAMRGDLALHSSTIRAGGGAVVFCGPSHQGKSTLARSLGEAGHEVLAEDGVDVSLEGRPTAYPGPRGVRIRRPGGVDLAPDPGPAEPPPLPVSAVVVLGERGARLEFETLEPALALTQLTPALIHDGSRAGIGDAFARLARLLHTVPVFRARLPDDLAALPSASRKVLDCVTDAG
jgi:hypothetical protein